MVGLSYGWKSAYYFSNGPNSVTQKQLVLHALKSVNNKGFQTLDGHATNMSMCTRLGADTHCDSTSTAPTSITPLPGQTHITYVCPYACHMIKLMRNTMEAYGGFRTPDGVVSWEHIKKLELCTATCLAKIRQQVIGQTDIVQATADESGISSTTAVSLSQ